MRMQRECDVCGARGDRATKLLKCDGCKSVLYCSEACQRAHWPEHKRVCRRPQRNNAAEAATAAAGAEQK
jgi:hypothetical protein